jgi:hypothetical protein
MKLQSQKLADYLQCTAVIDWQTPAVIEQTQAVTASGSVPTTCESHFRS